MTAKRVSYVHARYRATTNARGNQKAIIQAPERNPYGYTMFMSIQILWCARCRTAFQFTGKLIEHTDRDRLAIRHECDALNEIAVLGETQEDYDLYRVVPEVRPRAETATR